MSLKNEAQKIELSKRTSKFIVVASAVLLLLKMFGAFILYNLFSVLFGAASQASSIGIIGGADGPSAIFVSSHPTLPAILGFVLFFLADIVFYIFLLVKFGKSLRKGNNQ